MQRLSLDYQKTGITTSKLGGILLLTGIAGATYTLLQFNSTESALAIAEDSAGHLEQQI